MPSTIHSGQRGSRGEWDRTWTAVRPTSTAANWPICGGWRAGTWEMSRPSPFCPSPMHSEIKAAPTQSRSARAWALTMTHGSDRQTGEIKASARRANRKRDARAIGAESARAAAQGRHQGQDGQERVEPHRPGAPQLQARVQLEREPEGQDHGDGGAELLDAGRQDDHEVGPPGPGQARPEHQEPDEGRRAPFVRGQLVIVRPEHARRVGLDRHRRCPLTQCTMLCRPSRSLPPLGADRSGQEDPPDRSEPSGRPQRPSGRRALAAVRPGQAPAERRVPVVALASAPRSVSVG